MNNLSIDGVSLLVEDVKEFENQDSLGMIGSADMKVLMKLGEGGMKEDFISPL